MALNQPTYGRFASTVVTREGEVPHANFNNGANLGASNGPGVGISTGVVNPKLTDWTVTDQHGDPRTPEKAQHIGGNGLEGGTATTDRMRVVTTQLDDTGDINDEAHFVAASGPVPPGSDIGGGVINRTGEDLVAGDRVWGVLPV